jgi:CheY-like chemotaxis protein
MATKLLLVEDSLSIQTIVETTFAREGFDVLVVSDALDGLQKIQTVMPDIVLADASMPGMDGFQLCQRIRQSAHGRHIPVVLLTSGFTAYDEARGDRAGVTTHLAKPFEPRLLLDLVKQLVIAAPPPTAAAAATLLPRLDDIPAPREPVEVVLPSTPEPAAETLTDVWRDTPALADLSGLSPWADTASPVGIDAPPAVAPPAARSAPAEPLPATVPDLAHTLGGHLLQCLQEALEAQMIALCAQLMPQILATVREVAHTKMPELLAVLLQQEIEKLKQAAEHDHHGE